jgi:hypothetical protein
MGCVFCQPDRAILAETKLSLAFLDSFPVSDGPGLVTTRCSVGSGPKRVMTVWLQRLRTSQIRS